MDRDVAPCKPGSGTCRIVVLSVKIYERLHFDFGFVRDSEYNMPMAADHSDMRFAAFQ